MQSDTAPNACQGAFAALAARPDAERHETNAGPYLEIRRKTAIAGALSDGTRVYRVAPCLIWRWLTVSIGWGEIAEFDQRDYHGDPARLAADVAAAIDKHATERN